MIDSSNFPYEYWITPENKNHNKVLREWCNENFGQCNEVYVINRRWVITEDSWTIRVLLQREEDAVLFKLTWC